MKTKRIIPLLVLCLCLTGCALREPAAETLDIEFRPGALLQTDGYEVREYRAGESWERALFRLDDGYYTRILRVGDDSTPLNAFFEDGYFYTLGTVGLCRYDLSAEECKASMVETPVMPENTTTVNLLSYDENHLYVFASLTQTEPGRHYRIRRDGGGQEEMEEIGEDEIPFGTK